ncbi:hypothetical protein [Nostoc sp.]|uniref:hypothetical protein n=1 Tax=Nostoc sp. TaxID=1180 RepID=UPI002FF45740
MKSRQLIARLFLGLDSSYNSPTDDLDVITSVGRRIFSFKENPRRTNYFSNCLVCYIISSFAINNMAQIEIKLCTLQLYRLKLDAFLVH